MEVQLTLKKGAGEFYNDSQCTQVTNSMTIQSSGNLGKFFFKTEIVVDAAFQLENTENPVGAIKPAVFSITVQEAGFLRFQQSDRYNYGSIGVSYSLDISFQLSNTGNNNR